jgi:hypothetical protein
VAVAVTDPRQVPINPVIFVNAAFRPADPAVRSRGVAAAMAGSRTTCMRRMPGPSRGTASGIHLDSAAERTACTVLSTFSVAPLMDAAGEPAFLLAAQEESSLHVPARPF